MGLLAVVFTLFNLSSPKLVGVAAGEWADAHSLIFAGALLLYVGTLIRAWRTSRPATPPLQKLKLADKP